MKSSYFQFWDTWENAKTRIKMAIDDGSFHTCTSHLRFLKGSQVMTVLIVPLEILSTIHEALCRIFIFIVTSAAECISLCFVWKILDDRVSISMEVTRTKGKNILTCELFPKHLCMSFVPETENDYKRRLKIDTSRKE